MAEHVGETVTACGLVVEQRTHHQLTGSRDLRIGGAFRCACCGRGNRGVEDVLDRHRINLTTSSSPLSPHSLFCATYFFSDGRADQTREQKGREPNGQKAKRDCI